MTALKVLSLHQPWATFVMLGVKRFETRPGPPAGDMRPEGMRPGIGGCALNRGDVIGIASTQNPEGITAEGLTEGGWAYNYFGADAEYQACWCFRSSDEGRRGQTMLTGPNIDIGDESSIMPLGHLLGTVRVVDAYPMVDDPLARNCVDMRVGRSGLALRIDEAEDVERITDISTEEPYGDWRPGRWAIELADPMSITEGCLECAGDPFHRASCWLCRGERPCAPVPVFGRQGVWNLTPDRLRYPT